MPSGGSGWSGHSRVSVLAAIGAVLLPVGCGEPRDGASATDRGDADGAAALFTDITEQAGLDFVHDAGVDGSYFYPQIIGAGGALLDYDSDGDLDIYLVSGAHRTPPSGPPPTNRLYRREADGRYRDVTAESGLGHPGFDMGVAVGDYDNDGHPDLHVTSYGPDVLFRNNGDGTFTDVTSAAGIDNPLWSVSASFFDEDWDGDLDLFVVNYVDSPTPRVCRNEAGQPEFCGPTAFPGTPDVLYRNNGDGTFTDASRAAGIDAIQGRGLGVACHDFDGDGQLDVFVANDGEANFLWMNRGGVFTEAAAMAGVALNRFANTEASMGVAAGDVDEDGDVDLFMTHLVRESNTSYRNDGLGTFDDVTASMGLEASSLAYTGFGTALLDFDHDGGLDLVVVNGRVKAAEVLAGADGTSPLAAYAEPNLLYRGDGRGRFVDVSEHAGALCRDVEIGRGLATGDIDGDGDLDLLVCNNHGPARLYRNDAASGGHWLLVRVVDSRLRRDAYGAQVTVHAGGRVRRRIVNPGLGYASSSDPRVHVGLGDARRVELLQVRWPDGHVRELTDVAADQSIVVERAVDAG
jgi:hypothetical protein